MYWLCPLVFISEVVQGIKSNYGVRHLSKALLAFHAMMVGIRIMVSPVGHSIYCCIAVFMIFLLVLERIGRLLTQAVASPCRTSVIRGMLVIESVALLLVLYPRQIERSAVVETDRGRIYGQPSEATLFPEVIRFLKQRRAKNETVAIQPEETSLYFLSGTRSCWYMFHPGILDLEERQRQYISDLEIHQMKYILLSNRTTEDYGLPFFGLHFSQQSMLGSSKTST